MKPAFIIFCLMVVVGLILYLIDLRGRKGGDGESQPSQPNEPVQPACVDESCSLHGMCPSDMLLESMASEEIVYYDDEELDTFKGRPATGYTSDEEELWRDVIYTLAGSDLLGWEQSVKKRGLVMPASIHDEFIMLYGEVLAQGTR